MVPIMDQLLQIIGTVTVGINPIVTWFHELYISKVVPSFIIGTYKYIE